MFFLELGLKFDKNSPITTINFAMNNISKKFEDVHNIVLIDEVVSVNELQSNKTSCDWRNLNTSISNVDFLIALNPQGVKFKAKFKVVPPKSKNVLCKQLISKHRNSFEPSRRWLPEYYQCQSLV